MGGVSRAGQRAGLGGMPPPLAVPCAGGTRCLCSWLLQAAVGLSVFCAFFLLSTISPHVHECPLRFVCVLCLERTFVQVQAWQLRSQPVSGDTVQPMTHSESHQNQSHSERLTSLFPYWTLRCRPGDFPTEKEAGQLWACRPASRAAPWEVRKRSRVGSLMQFRDPTSSPSPRSTSQLKGQGDASPELVPLQETGAEPHTCGNQLSRIFLILSLLLPPGLHRLIRIYNPGSADSTP